MKFRRLTRISSLLLCLSLCSLSAGAADEGRSSTKWESPNLPFRVLNVTSNGPAMWVCGTDEAIAVSSDGGQHWELRHESRGGNLLLNIEFADEKFGYSAGTGGVFLTTEDGGQTWLSHSGGTETVLEISFADPQTGLIRTPESLLFTADGGSNWSTVSAGANAETLKSFPYSFSLVALDSKHMAIMLKSGAAQYESQTFLITGDGGKSWHVESIPNVTLYSFLRMQGKYWAIGTEVIHKDQPGGGHAVPVELNSSDGAQWTHSTSDISACQLEMCVACTSRGCLSSNGTIANVFEERPTYWEFPSTPKLTPKWAATGASMCFVGTTLQCAAITVSAQAKPGEDAVPAAIGPGPLGGTAARQPRCIQCPLDHFIVDQKVQGIFTIKLALEIGKNGTVAAAEVDGAPTPGIKSRIEQQAGQWVFEPYIKDGVRVGLKLNTSVQVAVVRSK